MTNLLSGHTEAIWKEVCKGADLLLVPELVWDGVAYDRRNEDDTRTVSITIFPLYRIEYKVVWWVTGEGSLVGIEAWLVHEHPYRDLTLLPEATADSPSTPRQVGEALRRSIDSIRAVYPAPLPPMY